MIRSAVCEGADLCQEMARNTDTSFARTYQGDPPTRHILGTENLALIADMSPLVAGHLLLLPKTHYLSFSHVIDDHLPELMNFVETIAPLYRETFGELLVLEHGSSADGNGNACITHAHWHLLPVDGAEVDRIIQADRLAYTDLTDLAELGSPRWTPRPYFYRCHRGHMRVYEPSPTTRRQYLRSVVGAVLSIETPLWDYALVIRKELLRETMRRVRQWPRTEVAQ
jgi:diadenosine tetraphosphate (Ap4A) HIT family hydrolase